MSLLGWVACVVLGAVCGTVTTAATHSWLDGAVTSAVIGFLAACGGVMWERIWR